MATNYTSPIPVTTVKDNSYPHPQLNADGQWVVSASAVKSNPNKIVLYNPVAKAIVPVTPYTVSLDYYAQVKYYEKTLAQIQREQDVRMQGYSDTYNTTQVNSIADILTAGDKDNSIFKLIGGAVPKLFDGDFKGAGQEVWKHSVVNALTDKVKATGEFLDNTLIDPLTSTRYITDANGERIEVPDTIGSKGLKLLNNALVNLGETMDMITGANMVKGAVQGLGNGGLPQALANVKAANGDVYGAGHKQFDWNLHPSGTILDTVLNIGLEILSDPTTYITLGTSGAIKGVGKSAFREVLGKSVKEVGLDVAENDLDSLSNAALHTFLHKDSSVVDALRTSKVQNKLLEPVDAQTSIKLFNTITKNVNNMKEAKTLTTLKSVRGVSDDVQTAAMKAVGLSSSLGLGYGMVKAGLKSAKVGVDGLSYITAKINSTLKKSNLDVATDKTINEYMQTVEKELTTFQDLFEFSDDTKSEIVRRATRTFQEQKYSEVNKILGTNKPSAKVYSELNQWANTQGFDNVEVWLDNAVQRSNIVPEEVASMAQEVQHGINKTIHKARAEAVDRFADIVDPVNVRQYNATEYRDTLIAYDRAIKLPDIANNFSKNTITRARRALVEGVSLAAIQTAKENFEQFKNIGGLAFPTLFEHNPIAKDAVADATKYATRVLANPNAYPFLKKNAEQMLNLINSDQYYLILKDTGMTMDKADTIMDTLNNIIKYNRDEIIAGHINKADIKLLIDTMNMWKADSHSIILPVLQDANAAWDRIYKYFTVPASRYNEVDEHALAIKVRNNARMFTTMHRQLKRIAELTEAVPSTGAKTIHTITSDIISKAANTIPEAIADALESKGLYREDLSKVVLSLSGVKLTDIVSNDNITEAFTEFKKLTDALNDDYKQIPYFVQQLNLYPYVDRWEKGFSIQLGDEVLGQLDDLLARLGDVDEIKPDVQLVRDMLQNIIDFAFANVEERVKTTVSLASTKLYQVKESHISALVRLLDTPGLEDTLEQIRTNKGIGEFLDAVYDVDAQNYTTTAINNLRSLSKSTFVSKKFLNLIKTSKFSNEWKDGIYDTLAGLARKKRSTIPDVDTFTAELLGGAKRFIDNKNNKHPTRLYDLADSRNEKDLLSEVRNLYKHAFDETEVTQEQINYWKPIYDAVHADEDHYNLVYSAMPTSKDGAVLFQFAYTLPDGTSGLYINEPLYHGMIKNMNDATAQELFGTTAERATDMLKRNLNKYASDKSVKTFKNDEAFATAMYEILQTAKQTAMDENKIPRLIGYNNSLYSLGTDKALSNYTYKNLLNTRILYNGASFKGALAMETLDAAELMRIAHDGALEVTENMHTDLARVVTEVKQYLDRANIGTTEDLAYVMPDFTRDTTTAFRELVSVLDNVSEINANGMSDDLFKSLNKSQYMTLRTAYTQPEITALRQDITSILEGVGETMISIKQSNQALGQTLLIQDKLQALLQEPNIMQILNKYLVDSAGVPRYSLKLYNDPAVFNSWYTDVPEDMSTLTKMYRVADVMQGELERIKHPALLFDESPATVLAFATRLREILLGLPNRKYSIWNETILKLKLEPNNQLQNYVIARQYWKWINQIAPENDVRKLVLALDETFPDSALTHYVINPDATVMFNYPLYAPELKVLQSPLVDASNVLLMQAKEVEAIRASKLLVSTLEDEITLDQHLRDVHGHSLPSHKIKEMFLMSYNKFVGGIQQQLDRAKIKFMEDSEHESVDVRLIARQEYTATVNNIIEQMNELKQAHASARAQRILELSADDYMKFLFKYSQGVQVIHLGADIFKDASKDMQNLLKKFTKTLKDAEQLGVHYTTNPATDELLVYLDKTKVDMKGLYESTKDFKLQAKPLKGVHNTIGGVYADLVNKLDEYADGTYSISMHRTVTPQAYDDLRSYLPESIKSKLLTKEFLDEKNLLYGGFSQNVIGDYGYGIGNIYSTYSNNLITNVAAGFNTIYNHIRGKDLYQGLLFNTENKLATWLQHITGLGHKVSYQELNNALTKKHMVLCRWDETDGVVPVVIKNQKDYEHAIHSDTAMLDYFSYTKAVEVLNSKQNQLNSRWLAWLNKNFLSAIKLGQILSTGWFVRNIIDSTIKGWTQAGLDPMYMMSWFTRTKQIMASYDHTLAKAFEVTEAGLSDTKVSALFKAMRTNQDMFEDGAVFHAGSYLSVKDDVFKKHPEFLLNKAVHYLTKEDIDAMLDEQLFKKLLTFYGTSSSKASPAQLNLYSDLTRNLYARVRGNTAIKEADVAAAIDVFREYPNIFEAKKMLFNRYPEPIAKDLILLKKYVPEKEIAESWANKAVDAFLPTKKLMRANTDFENFVRTHTFLYQSEYTNGTASEAIHLVDKSQGNRARANKAEQLLEVLLPFSSFQLYNMSYWVDTALHNHNNILAFTEDVVSGAYNQEEQDVEELSRNMSLQYLFLSGNLILNDHDGLNFKTGDSIHNTLQILSNPVGTLSGMLNVPMDVLTKTLTAISENKNLDEYMQLMEENKEFGHTKPMGAYSKKDVWELYAQLIPLVGVLYQRYTSAWHKGKLEASDLILPLVAPSIFGVTKLDSAGTTYESRPIGTDWYTRTPEYKKQHRYLFGVSYIPSWMHKDPMTYANTYQRLLQMGYSESSAGYMIQNGWYMKAPSYMLQYYSPRITGSRYGRTYAPRTYYKYNHLPKKQKKFIRMKKLNKPEKLSGDRVRVTRAYRARRIYRLQNYSNRYTRTGVSRELMINWRGPNRSSRQLLRDRSHAQRMRIRTMRRQIKPS